MTRRLNWRDDSGASLVLVLILITVVALVMSALLSFSDTSIRSTVALRNQASEAYGADGAAQAAINQLRNDNFNGVAGGCDTPSTVTLPNFVPASSTAPAASATVRCTPDPSNAMGAGGSNSSPGSAILTLGTGLGGEQGLYVNSSNNQSVKVRGGIFSNSTIFLAGNKSDVQNTATNSYVYALGNCSSSGTSRIIANPAAVCDYASNPQSAFDRRGKDPGTIAGHGASFDAPPAPTTLQTPPACVADAVYEVQPGLYRSAAQLNALTNSAACSKSVFHFNPGRYYFNFDDAAVAHKWTISGGYLVAGTATATLRTTPPPTMPGSCVAPGSASATTSSGVQFIFGGDSRMDWTKNGTDEAHIEICASDSDSGPPIAVYGLKQDIGNGPMLVSAQSGCITNTGYPVGNSGAATTHCAVLQSYNDPYPQFTIQGTTYTPRAMIDLYLNNNTVQVFRWGLVTRGLHLGSTGSTGSLANPVIDVPDNAPAPFASPGQMYLDVFVCPGLSTCGTSGTVRLRAKVQVSSEAPRTVSVLSWVYPR